MTTVPLRPRGHRLRDGLDQALLHLHGAATAFDRLPVSPHSVADAVLRGRLRTHDSKTGRDADEVTSMTWEEFRSVLRTRLRTRDSEPTWVEMARAVRDWRLAGLTWRIRMAVQMVQRGWCEQDAWNLDQVLCTRLAAQMESLADQLHGWPESAGFPTPQDWDSALRATAADLRRVAGSAETLAAADEWTACWGDAEREREAYARYIACEAADNEAVTRALRWVAEHHQHLWD